MLNHTLLIASASIAPSALLTRPQSQQSQLGSDGCAGVCLRVCLGCVFVCVCVRHARARTTRRVCAGFSLLMCVCVLLRGVRASVPEEGSASSMLSPPMYRTYIPNWIIIYARCARARANAWKLDCEVREAVVDGWRVWDTKWVDRLWVGCILFCMVFVIDSTRVTMFRVWQLWQL